MATRVGKYVWEIDMENMSADELTALEDAARHFKHHVLAKKYVAELRDLIMRAAKDDVTFYYERDPYYGSITCADVVARYEGD